MTCASIHMGDPYGCSEILCLGNERLVSELQRRQSKLDSEQLAVRVRAGLDGILQLVPVT